MEGGATPVAPDGHLSRVLRRSPICSPVSSPPAAPYSSAPVIALPALSLPLARRRALVLALPLAALGLAACSSSRPVAPRPAPSVPAAPRVDIAATETMPLGPYLAERPAEAVPVEHEVPAELMNNAVREAPRPPPAPAPSRPTTPSRPTAPATPRPTRPVFRTVQGYRVQVVQSTNRADAERAVQTAMAWWRRSRGGSPEVYLVYRAPYYRVRVGNYSERGESDRVARSLNASFPNAFSVPDRVTVREMVEQ